MFDPNNIDPVLWMLTLSGVAVAQGIAIVVLAVVARKLWKRIANIEKHAFWRDEHGRIISASGIKKAKPIAKVKADVADGKLSIPGKGEVPVQEAAKVEERFD